MDSSGSSVVRSVAEISVIGDGLGGAFIVWRDSRNVTSSDIYGQYIDANGNPKWTPNGVIISTAPGQQWAPAGITRTSDGKVAVVWFDDRNGNWDIYAQKFYNQGPSRFAVSSLPASIPVAVSTNVSVEIRDLLGQAVTGYTGSVGFYSDDPNAVLPSSYTFQPVDSGSKTFSVEFRTPGIRLFKVYDIDEPYLVGYATVNVTGIVPIAVEIKVPGDGKRVSGNRVTIMADLTSGSIFDVAKITFQYKQIFSDTWENIPAADLNNPNPDLNHPYFTHWDVSASTDNSYHVRALAEDRLGRYVLSPPITVYVDRINFDIEEKNVGLILQKRQKVFNDRENVVISADSRSNTHIEVRLATGSVAADTVLKVENDVTSPSEIKYFEKVKVCGIELESGQTALSGAVPSEISISYPDTDGDGIVDGTALKEDSLAIFSYNAQAGVWERNNTSKVDKTKKVCAAGVRHFSVYGLFGGSASNLNDILVYPNPYVPNDGDPDNGRPYGAGDPDSGIIFENLTDSVELKIYTASGGLVLEKKLSGSGGRYRWDARNGNGRDVASGIYLAVIKSGGQKTVRKIAVVR